MEEEPGSRSSSGVVETAELVMVLPPPRAEQPSPIVEAPNEVVRGLGSAANRRLVARIHEVANGEATGGRPLPLRARTRLGQLARRGSERPAA